MRRPVAAPATALAGAGALCVGIGLARFAYVPIFPAMVAAGWVDGGGAGLLGACNFSGYLAGALGGRWLGRRLGVPRALDAGMALAALSFLACALHWGGVTGLLWLALWRTLAGVAGGVLMALAGPSVQAVTPPEKRGAAGGVVVSGVGAGVVLGALAVPALRPAGVEAIWLGLAALTLLLWLVLRPRWPDPPAAEVMRLPQAQAVPRAAALMTAYGLSAAGMAAPMVYLADLGARGHGLGPLALGALWALFGLGGVAGTLLGGRAVGRIGGRATLLCWLSVQVAALLTALGPGGGFVLVSALLGGFSGIGISAVALGAVRQLSGVAAGLLWVRATALYAAAQALTGFVLAALFRASGDSHALVFAVALGLSVLGLLVALRVPRAN